MKCKLFDIPIPSCGSFKLHKEPTKKNQLLQGQCAYKSNTFMWECYVRNN